MNYRLSFALIIATLAALALGTQFGPAAPLDQETGPGGPILIITESSHPFGDYLVEIVRTEGFNFYTHLDLTGVSIDTLAPYQLVILGESTLTPANVTMFTDWVNAGGNLIAMRPDPQLTALLGLVDTAETLAEGYILIDNSVPPGQGITGVTMQFHGTADAYSLSGATPIAMLYSNRSTATAYPAVTLHSVGANGGKAAAFAYDLARSVVYTRQGNPALIGVDSHGDGRFTASDMFTGSWVDAERIHIPQADEQQRLLGNLMLHMTLDDLPLPRFWYLPRGEKAAMILTGDDHVGRGSPSANSLLFFDRHKAQSPVGCSVQDWECIRSSSYLYGSNTAFTDAQVIQYTNEGFEFALHPDAGLTIYGDPWCASWTYESMFEPTMEDGETYTAQMNLLRYAFPGMPQPMSERSHCYSWYGYAGKAEAIALHGVRMDVDVTYNPSSYWGNRVGYMPGTAFPMRFATENGSLVNVYNAPTLISDDNGGAASTRGIIDQMLDWATGSRGYISTFVINMHSDNWYGWSYAGSDEIVASAQAHGVPVVSGRQVTEWLDARNNSSFSGFTHINIPTGKRLNFTVVADPNARGLQIMLPYSNGSHPIAEITQNGSPISYSLETINGIRYALFLSNGGEYSADFEPDTTPPVITNIIATPALDGSVSVTWDTNEEATSRVDYGLVSDTLNLNVSSLSLTTAHHLRLSDLTPETRYYFQVVSTDAFNNTSTSVIEYFDTPESTFIDTTVADFTAGTPGTGTVITERANGEVALLPQAAENFNDNLLPDGWFWSSFTGQSGSINFTNGKLILDGAKAGTSATFGAGHSLEGMVTFNPVPYQHFGFGTTYNDPGWAIFSTGQDGLSLKARTNNTTTGMTDVVETPIPGNYFGVAHHYRIDWLADRVEYYLDGALVATHNLAFTQELRPLIGDSNSGGATLDTDWISMSPYAASGQFLSRIFDARGNSNWGALSWISSLPAGTELDVSVRTGNVYIPDASWTEFTPLLISGSDIPSSSRFLQYRLDLATANTMITPLVQEVYIGYDVISSDSTPPQVITRSPAPGSTGINPIAPIEVVFDEPLDPATVLPDRLSIRQVGSGFNLPAVLSYSGVTAVLQPSFPLIPSISYQVTLSGAVEDLAGNQLGSDLIWTFTTSSTGAFTDTTTSDFASGSLDSAVKITQRADGELILMPTLHNDFLGSTLPEGWLTSGSGTAAVGNGVLAVNGASVFPNTFFSAGRSLELSAVFRSDALQHIGFGDTLGTGPWAIFSTGASGTEIIVRTNIGTDIIDDMTTTLGSSYLGSAHIYRIEWLMDRVDYYIDGGLVASHSLTFTQNMRPVAADSAANNRSLDIDWISMGSFPSSGQFLSRIFDARGTADWGAISWQAYLPASTSLDISVRTGNTYIPDEAWGSWSTISTSGEPIGASGRYAQYRVLFTGNGQSTPLLEDVILNFNVTIPDTNAPQIISRTPAPGAIEVSPEGNINVTFNEPVEPTSFTDSTFYIHLPGYGAESATITVSGSTATLDPASTLQLSSLYEVVLDGDVVDLSGNPLGTGQVWTFTTVAENAYLDITVSPASQMVIETLNATFNVEVRNTGSVLLTNVQVSSAATPDCARPIGGLAPTAVHAYTCTHATSNMSFNSNFIVSGSAPSGRTITDTASSVVTVQTLTGRPWWNMDWYYLRPVKITCPCLQAATDYQARIELTNTNFSFAHGLSDGADLRVISFEGLPVPYWIESWDSFAEHAVVWVRTPSLPVNGTFVYLYYGNATPPNLGMIQRANQPSAVDDTDLNSPTEVFNFFDGFDGTALDNTRWSFLPDTGSGSRSTTVNSGYLNSTATTSGGFFYSQMVSNQTFGTGVVMETMTRHVSANGATAATELGFGSCCGTVIRLFDYNTANFVRHTGGGPGGSGSQVNTGWPVNSTDFLLHRLFRTTTGQAWFAIQQEPWQISADGTSPLTALPAWFMVYSESAPTPGNIQVDWIRVRNYCGEEAVATVLTEQPQEPTSVTLSEFRAELVTGGTRIIWQTVMEVDLIGFNILRSTSPDSMPSVINPFMIPANAGVGMGGEYVYTDLTAQPGLRYYYWLEIVNSTAAVEMVGPVILMAEHEILLPLIYQ